MSQIICLQCKKKFESQRKSAKFCSDACRVKSARKLKEKVSGVTTADKVPKPKSKKERIIYQLGDTKGFNGSPPIAIELPNTEEKWVDTFKNFFAEKDTTPEKTLKHLHKTWKKEGELPEKQKLPQSNFRSSLMAAKCGFPKSS